MFIIFLGPPGAGKGTQSELLAEKLKLSHISTGDLFRDQMEQNTKLGRQITDIMNSGKLVPDETTLEVFKKRLTRDDAKSGAILDGIPRTIEQAKMLDKLFEQMNKQIDHVIHIKLPPQEIITRLTGRWTCRQCGQSYHEKYNPPQTPGVCDLDGSPLYQRDDQKEEVVKERIRVYEELTKPLVEYYKNKGLLIDIDGQHSIEEVNADILKKLDVSA